MRPERTGSLLVVGDSHDDVAPAIAGATDGEVRFVSDLPDAGSCPAVDLAVGVFPLEDDARHLALAAWSAAAGVPTLAVSVGRRSARIGPLSIPGRVGCGDCALMRMAAARVDARPSADAEPDDLLDEQRPSSVPTWGSLLSREIQAIFDRGAQASCLLDHVLVVDAANAETSLHRTIPLSYCPVCGGAAALRAPASAAGEKLSPEASPEAVLAALDGWVDSVTGVIPGLVLDPMEAPGERLPFVVTAMPPHIVDADGSMRQVPLGWGKGFTVSGAILSAVGEAIERYAPFQPDPARIIWERPDHLEGEHLDPRSVALYSEAQYARAGFPYVRFDPAVRHPWVLGRWLDSGEPVWVPAVVVYLSLDLQREHLICQGTSNGLAAGAEYEDAALGAVLELVERDAFMAAWITGTPGQRVEIDALEPELGGALAAVESLGGAVEVYVLPTSACGTTALCLAFGDGERWPGVTLGLGADLDPRRAVRQAVLELGQTGPHLRRMMRSGILPVPAEPAAVREMRDHAAYYFPAERASAFDRLRAGAPCGDLAGLVADFTNDTAERSLASCATALSAAGVRVALVDVTSPDVATGPFRVVRAVSPDLQPLSYGYGLERPPVPRVLAHQSADDVPPVHPIW